MAIIKKISRVIFSDLYLILRLILGNKISSNFFCFISPRCTLSTESKGNIILGNKLMIRSFTEIKAVKGKIEIGDKVFINRNCMINAHDQILIGEGTTIGPGTYIYDHDHDGHGGFTTSAVIIGKNVWIGAGCIILKGTQIGDNAVIGAGTLICRNVLPNTLVVNMRSNYEKTLRGKESNKSLDE